VLIDNGHKGLQLRAEDSDVRNHGTYRSQFTLQFFANVQLDFFGESSRISEGSQSVVKRQPYDLLGYGKKSTF
jgi:hypothetical protein